MYLLISSQSHVYGRSCQWNVMSMECHVYGMSCLWNVMSMEFHVYGLSCLWNVMFMDYHVYGTSCLLKSCLCNVIGVIYSSVVTCWPLGRRYLVFDPEFCRLYLLGKKSTLLYTSSSSSCKKKVILNPLSSDNFRYHKPGEGGLYATSPSPPFKTDAKSKISVSILKFC